MAIIKFSSTQLQNLGKKGQLKKDSDGYYEIVIGGLNIENSSGVIYVLQNAKELFDNSSVLQRRIKNGSLYGEAGHPIKKPGMSMDDYITRVLSIENNNICCHFKEVWLDDSYSFNSKGVKNNTVAIFAKVKPYGPLAKSFEDSLENPDINTAMSIRSLSEDQYKNGTIYRTITEIVTWDWVIEPGISIATKWNTPTMEDYKDSIGMMDTNDLKKYMTNNGVSTEDSKLIIKSAINKTTKPEINSFKHVKPDYLK